MARFIDVPRNDFIHIKPSVTHIPTHTQYPYPLQFLLQHANGGGNGSGVALAGVYPSMVAQCMLCSLPPDLKNKIKLKRQPCWHTGIVNTELV